MRINSRVAVIGYSEYSDLHVDNVEDRTGVVKLFYKDSSIMVNAKELICAIENALNVPETE